MSLPRVVSLGSVLAPLAATVQGFAILVSLRWPTYIDRDARRRYLEQAALPMVQGVVTLLEPGGACPRDPGRGLRSPGLARAQLGIAIPWPREWEPPKGSVRKAVVG